MAAAADDSKMLAKRFKHMHMSMFDRTISAVCARNAAVMSSVWRCISTAVCTFMYSEFTLQSLFLDKLFLGSDWVSFSSDRYDDG